MELNNLCPKGGDLKKRKLNSLTKKLMYLIAIET
jgi:hypothetical protein